MTRALSLVDRLSALLAGIAMALFLVLVCDMMYEVVARRVFGAPTLWAYDIAYMANGSIFLLAAAFTLRVNEHVRIDFLSTRFPRKVQDAINAVVYVGLVFPTLGFICWGALSEGWAAFLTDELEPSSPWRPLLWPFYAGIALGFCAFALQAVAQCVRHIRSIAGLAPSPFDTPDVGV